MTTENKPVGHTYAVFIAINILSQLHYAPLCACNAITPYTLILHTDPHCLLGLCIALRKRVNSLTKSGQTRTVACAAVGDTKRQLMTSSSSTTRLTYKGQCFIVLLSISWTLFLVLAYHLGVLFFSHSSLLFWFLDPWLSFIFPHFPHIFPLDRSLSILMSSRQDWIIEEKGELRNYLHSLSRKW